MKETEPNNASATAPSPKAGLSETDPLVPAAFDRDPRRDPRGWIWKETICLLATFTLGFLFPILHSDSQPEFQFLFPCFLVGIFAVSLLMMCLAYWLIRTWKLRSKSAKHVVEQFERIRERVRATEPSVRHGRIDWLYVLLFASLSILVLLAMANNRTGGRPPEMVLCVFPFFAMIALWYVGSRERKKSLVRMAERLESGISPEEVFFGERTGKEAASNTSVLSRLSRILDNIHYCLPLGYSPRARLFAGDCAFAIFLISLLMMILLGSSAPGLVGFLFMFSFFLAIGLFYVVSSYLSPCDPLAFWHAVLPRTMTVQADGAAVECVKAMLADLEPVPRKPVRKSRKPVTQNQWNAVMGSRPFRSVGGDNPVRNVSAREVAFFLSVLDELDFVKEAGLLFYARPQSFWLWSTGFRLYAE